MTSQCSQGLVPNQIHVNARGKRQPAPEANRSARDSSIDGQYLPGDEASGKRKKKMDGADDSILLNGYPLEAKFYPR